MKVSRFSCLLGAIFSCAAALAQSQADIGAMAKWETIDYSKTTVDASQIAVLSVHQLALLRGIIFGRHGREFKETEIQDYLATRPWYKADEQFTNAWLNPTERANLDKVRLLEAARHPFVQPGDLRYWTDKPFGIAKLKTASLLDDHIMKAEIEAIHGKTFPREPAMQAYFEDRYWYVANPSYSTRMLSETEKKNLSVLTEAERSKGRSALDPSQEPLFQTRLISDEAIAKATLYDLRLVRNGFYALHGRRFKKAWLDDYFETQEWYKPSDKITPLTRIEELNVAKILRRETAIHEGLDKTLITKPMLEGLQLEDVRNLKDEIYARHGRVFRTTWLQSYFSSLPWYKANAKYADSLLNDVEKRNVEFLASAQQQLQAAMDMEEG